MTYDVFSQISADLDDPDYRIDYGRESAKLEFALALIRARKGRGLTQTDVALLMGVKQPYVARLESGEANPTIGKAGSILATLWAKPSWNLTPLIQVSAVDEKLVDHPISGVPMTGEEIEERMGRLALVTDNQDEVQRNIDNIYEAVSDSGSEFASAA